MQDFKQQQREAAAIRTDISKAYKAISDAKARYIKAKLKAKSKKQTEELETLFADLEDYASKQEIQDVYGYGDITLTEYDRLCNLWDAREEYTKQNGIYSDRVVEMLNKAAARLGDDYQEILYEADTAARENERNQQGRFPKDATTWNV